MFTPETLSLRRASAAAGGPDTHLLAYDDDDYLNCYDITDPSSPSFVSRITRPHSQDQANRVAIKDGYLYSPHRTGDSINIIDVSDPSSMSFTANVSISPDTDPQFVYAHPDKDFIVTQGTNTRGILTIDISNPASPSANSASTASGNRFVPDAGFNRAFVVGSLVPTALTSFALANSAMGSPTTESLSITSDSRESIEWDVSPVDGNNYLWHGGVNYLAVIEFGSDLTPDSEYYVADGVNYDRVSNIRAMPDLYSSTYKSVVAITARDDDKLMIVGYDGSSFTILASDVPSGASLMGYGMAVTGNYIISGDAGVNRFHIWEWDSETSLSLLSTVTDATYLNNIKTFITYTP